MYKSLSGQASQYLADDVVSVVQTHLYQVQVTIWSGLSVLGG